MEQRPPDGYMVQGPEGLIVWPGDASLATKADAILAAALYPGAIVVPVLEISGVVRLGGGPRSTARNPPEAPPDGG